MIIHSLLIIVLSEGSARSLELRRNDGQPTNRLWPWPWPWPCHCTYLAPNPIQPDESKEKKNMEEPTKLNHTPGPRMKVRNAREARLREHKNANTKFVIYETTMKDSVIADYRGKVRAFSGVKRKGEKGLPKIDDEMIGVWFRKDEVRLKRSPLK